jgi:hypothetical protein
MVEIAGSNPAETTRDTPVVRAAKAPPLQGGNTAGSSPAGSTAEWTGVAPARSHKPSDAGSNPASAIQESGIRHQESVVRKENVLEG